MREKLQYVHQLMHIAFLLRSFILHLTGYKSVHRDQPAKYDKHKALMHHVIV
jgi:hypothetical protein